MVKDVKETQSDIPGWIFILIGVVISVISYVMNKTNDSKSMTIFLFLGFALCGWGVAKMFLFAGSNSFFKKKKKDNMNSNTKNYHSQNSHSVSNEKMHSSHNLVDEKMKLKKSIKHCPNCGYALHKTDNYCYNCGTDVRNL
jgi:ribosomal protein S27AE